MRPSYSQKMMEGPSPFEVAVVGEDKDRDDEYEWRSRPWNLTRDLLSELYELERLLQIPDLTHHHQRIQPTHIMNQPKSTEWQVAEGTGLWLIQQSSDAIQAIVSINDLMVRSYLRPARRLTERLFILVQRLYVSHAERGDSTPGAFRA
ncbi:hypothetical protein H0G86_009922 [Trichoderma simmonsii]|uniref:Uncharacterized protein n=1 Tax=Trichoderma simmonsii TaxID=1491479 RepID=A0A8G0LL98_9HYPO|nr:hypothetical protein H0G86_009922 [Trichoderma simmonsii]